MSDEERPQGKSSALRSAAAELIMATVGASFRRSKLVNAELNVLLDVEDENEMLRELEDLLAQEGERFAEVFARTCQSKIRWAESRNKSRRREAAATEVQSEAISSRGPDSSSALIEAFERAFSLSTDVGRVRRLELLLKTTRRYSVQRERQVRRSSTD